MKKENLNKQCLIYTRANKTIESQEYLSILRQKKKILKAAQEMQLKIVPSVKGGESNFLN